MAGKINTKFREKLFSAAMLGYVPELRTLMMELLSLKRHWIDCRSARGDTILHVASRQGKFEVLRFLFEFWNGRDFVGIRNNDGKSALHEAAACCSPESVEILLSNGAEVNVMKTGDWTPLMLACTKLGQSALNTVKILLNNSADPFLINKDGWTALHVASRTGNLEIVALLLMEFPSLANMKSFNGRYPLHTASLHGNCNTVKLLLTYNHEIVSQPDWCGNTPIIEAARGDHVQIILLLLDHGASVMETDNMGMNCLHVAAQAASYDVIKLLVTEMHIDVNVVNKKFRLAPLHYAAKAGHVEIIKQLLKLGADPLLADSCGRQVLDFIFNNPERQSITKLLEEYKNTN